jgi:hypothetical protein
MRALHQERMIAEGVKVRIRDKNLFFKRTKEHLRFLIGHKREDDAAAG